MLKVDAYQHEEWQEHGLQDFGEFSDRLAEFNMRDGSGEWAYIPSKPLPAMKGVDYGGQTPNEWVIYLGTWGNENSPGASHYTWAEIYDFDDPEEKAAYDARVKEIDDFPEWIEEESDDPDDLDDLDEDLDAAIDEMEEEEDLDD